MLRGVVETGDSQKVCRPAVIPFGQIPRRNLIKDSLLCDISRSVDSVRYSVPSSWGGTVNCTMSSNLPYWMGDGRSVLRPEAGSSRRIAIATCGRLGHTQVVDMKAGLLPPTVDSMSVLPFDFFLWMCFSSISENPLQVSANHRRLYASACYIHHEDQPDCGAQGHKLQRWIPEPHHGFSQEELHNKRPLEVSCSLYPRLDVPFPIW